MLGVLGSGVDAMFAPVVAIAAVVTGARAALARPIPGESRSSDVVDIRRVVDVKPRLHREHLVVGQGSPVLSVDVARQKEIGPAIEDDSQLTSRRRDVVTA